MGINPSHSLINLIDKCPGSAKVEAIMVYILGFDKWDFMIAFFKNERWKQFWAWHNLWSCWIIFLIGSKKISCLDQLINN